MKERIDQSKPNKRRKRKRLLSYSIRLGLIKAWVSLVKPKEVKQTLSEHRR